MSFDLLPVSNFEEPGSDADSDLRLLDAGQNSNLVADGGAGVTADGDTRVGYNVCPVVDGDTLALFKAEGPAKLLDETGNHTGSLNGTVGRVPGPPACGGKAHDYSGSTTFGTIADSPDWDLVNGSVEFWIYLTDYTGDGIVCRDSFGTLPGHFAIVSNADGHIVVRIQDMDLEYIRCSRDPLPLNTWHHIGVNFGPGELSLFIDGVPGDRVEKIDGFSRDWSFNCTDRGGAANGLRGNDNPWTVGGLCWLSAAGTNSSVGNYLNGYLDELRISNVQRPF